MTTALSRRVKQGGTSRKLIREIPASEKHFARRKPRKEHVKHFMPPVFAWLMPATGLSRKRLDHPLSFYLHILLCRGESRIYNRFVLWEPASQVRIQTQNFGKPPGLDSCEVNTGLPEFKHPFREVRSCLGWSQGCPGAIQNKDFKSTQFWR